MKTPLRKDFLAKNSLVKNFRFLEPIAMIFVAILLISNVASTKIVDFGMLDFDGGTLLFPLSYIFGDILTEVYGYGRTRRIIWMGFAMNIFMVLVWTVGAPRPIKGPGCISKYLFDVCGPWVTHGQYQGTEMDESTDKYCTTVLLWISKHAMTEKHSIALL